MIGSGVLLLADLAGRTTYELAGWEALTEWWQIALLIAACVAIAVFVIAMYTKDCVEAGRGWACVLVSLRLLALAGALVVFLRPERRDEQPVVHNSRVLILVDTSSSMAWRDADASTTRLQQVIDYFAREQMIDQVRIGHDCLVAGFDADLTLHSLLPKESDGATPPDAATPGNSTNDESDSPDWATALTATGGETRLVECVRKLLHQQRSEPLSAVIVMTDGGDTTGGNAEEAIAMARDLRVPVFVVGIGTVERQRNVAISGVTAPTLVYPGDKFQITVRVRAQDFAGRRPTVRVYSRDADDSKAATKKLVGRRRITLGADGEDFPVTFDITPAEDDVGRRLYSIELDAFTDDVSADDNTWGPLPIEIVERRLRVLLIAGGPTREYRFLRNQLRRDRQMDLVEWPQWADADLDHEAHEVVHEFPASLAELDEFDAVVAIDPDWQALATEQLSALERWVGNQAGGMIAIAGPIYTDHWTYDPRMAKLRTLYPVRFSQRFSLLDDEPGGNASKAWPLAFTDEGLQAKFLWLEDDAVESKNVWSQFEGVYGSYRVRGGELGTTVHAHLTDPDAGDAIYMAEQIYGAGRVFFLGSGEMWRLRTLSDGYFETFYTKLLRHVSQHRLNRQNSRGMLLVNRQPYSLGSTITVRAQLKDEQFKPLKQASVPLDVIQPNQSKQTITLTPETAHPGMFVGELTAAHEGLYQLLLPVPGSLGDAVTADIRVEASDAEAQNRLLNEPLLKQLSTDTGGDYYAGLADVQGTPGTQQPLVEQLADQTRTTYLVGAPDLDWQREWMQWLLGAMCGLLCLEWTIRRLLKLA